MARKNDTVRIEVEWPKLTATDLDEFGRLLESCREERTFDFQGEKKTYSIINIEEAMVKFGAMKKTYPHAYGGKIPCYAVIMRATETDDWGNARKWERPSRYDIFNYTYDSWRRRQFARNIQDETYENAILSEPATEPEPEYETK